MGCFDRYFVFRIWSNFSIFTLIIKLTSSACISPISTNAALCFNISDPNLMNHKLEENYAKNSTFQAERPISFPYWDQPYSASYNSTDFVESESRADVNLQSGRHVYLEPTRKKHPGRVKSKSRTHLHSIDPDGKYSKKPIFIPVAAYSITKKRPKKKKQINSLNKQRMSASNISLKRKRPIVFNDDKDEDKEESGDEGDETDDDYEMRKESAVYGYIHKPEIIEFRGQYYYGQQDHDQMNKYNPKQPMVEYDENTEPMAPMLHERHRVSYMPIDTIEHEPSASTLLWKKLKKVLLYKGVTAKGLLLASLPLMLTPMLSYLLTPVVIPITATVAAGRRRKRSFMDVNSTFESPKENRYLNDIDHKKLVEAKILLEYLSKVKPDERTATSSVANFLECDGLLLPSDRCLEQLSCEFSDVRNENASHLERSVTSIILGHLLHNEFISIKFKKRLKLAALYGRVNSGQCKQKYPCKRVLLNQING